MMGHVPENQAVNTAFSVASSHCATGSVTNSAPAKANKRNPWFAAGHRAGHLRLPCPRLASCSHESLPVPNRFTLGESKWL
jgi:hypothetical protein